MPLGIAVSTSPELINSKPITTPASKSNLLKEDGDAILQENGDLILT